MNQRIQCPRVESLELIELGAGVGSQLQAKWPFRSDRRSERSFQALAFAKIEAMNCHAFDGQWDSSSAAWFWAASCCLVRWQSHRSEWIFEVGPDLWVSI